MIYERSITMIRKACKNDINRILEIYGIARNTMINSGNPNQWESDYPPKELLEDHITKEQLYVLVCDEQIHGAFALVFGEDPSYLVIEDGQWMNTDSYASLHLVASSGEKAGVFEQFCLFSKERSNNLRIDTHDDNKIMQHCIEKQGFTYCGRIYVREHSPRRAYQWVNK